MLYSLLPTGFLKCSRRAVPKARSQAFHRCQSVPPRNSYSRPARLYSERVNTVYSPLFVPPAFQLSCLKLHLIQIHETRRGCG